MGLKKAMAIPKNAAAFVSQGFLNVHAVFRSPDLSYNQTSRRDFPDPEVIQNYYPIYNKFCYALS
ncbi:MAG: hypothetical protein WCC06_04870 [Candidatus Aminicenantales bacterium]